MYPYFCHITRTHTTSSETHPLCLLIACTSLSPPSPTALPGQIKDLDQPLIVAEASRRGGSDPLLIPELCSFTGLTDQMRKDYRVMRDLSRIMALPPDQLINRIQGVR